MKLFFHLLIYAFCPFDLAFPLLLGLHLGVMKIGRGKGGEVREIRDLFHLEQSPRFSLGVGMDRVRAKLI